MTCRRSSMSSPVQGGTCDLQDMRIDPELFRLDCPRTIWNRAAVIYHSTCAVLGAKLPEHEVFAACVSYALKECCASTNSPSLLDMRKKLSEINVAAVEVLIFECVRPHVILIESCFRLQLKMLVLQAPHLHGFREPITRVALALAQKLYLCSYCLFPESCARACLLAACSLYPLDMDYSALSAEFFTPFVDEVCTYLLHSEDFASPPVLPES